VGRLLIRHLIHTKTRIPYQSIKLARTKEGKPYWIPPKESDDDKSSVESVSTVNFNVSHHSHWVILACESAHLVGCDVMSIEITGKDQNQERFFQTLRSCFTKSEWQIILEEASERDRLKQFFLFWTLKESFIKAIGIGLGFELQNAEFFYPSDSKPGVARKALCRLVLDGQAKYSEAPEWAFAHFSLDDDHVCAVALGPLSYSYGDVSSGLAGGGKVKNKSNSTSAVGDKEADKLNSHLLRKFELMSVSELLPDPKALKDKASNPNTSLL